jgi:flagellar biogenesis protein FliO
MDVLRQVASVLTVLALLGAALWGLRGRRAAALGWWRRSEARSKSLQSIDRLALSPQHSLHLVEIEGRQLVVATHPRGCTLLTEIAKGAGA